ncbi:hypothetical protein EW146_g1338 [Bondarzewia mesenterica]|uniref:Btz domain-containing protein n=1 Tax=Bondarzewia mesenterica TaxID=1095465 RepID=A0A4S4M430_9AGAM|nr:hypothetical protein EW146_g1338 [Bondarzewia mesenterica]
MPAPTSTKAAKPSSIARAQSLQKKTRFVRRRGRANDSIYSDEEFEREARTDSESDDDRSSLDSESDSETEPASEDVPATGHPEVVIPSSTHTPQPPDSLRSRKAERGGKRPVPERTSSAPATTPSPVPPPEHSDRAESPAPSASQPHERASSTPRRTGQTARQAYQERLESDPSYVPTVGEFWGHDDRLLDKDLRSLSGWWRGRWQGRGMRGRGRFNNGFGMRGRGGFFPNTRPPVSENENAEDESADVPPVERPWTHDGFEEMKKRDERRNGMQQQQQSQRGFMRGGFRGARGGFVQARGRGFTRGGFSPASPYPRQGLPSASPRIWYAMKPERVWTKHHESFLFSDPALKPRVGQGPAFRIKLPGEQLEEIVRLPPRSWPTRSSPSPPATPGPDTTKSITVRLPPPRTDKGKAAELEPTAVEEPTTTVTELTIDDAFIITQPPPPTIIPLPEPAKSQPPSSPPFNQAPVLNDVQQIASEPPPEISPSESNGGWIEVSDVPQMEERAQPPVLPPLQTVFSPMAQPSPSFGSPYGYAPTLPPGIMLNQHGFLYEVATGRAVYLQPPPGPMYNPRSVMSSHMSMPSGTFLAPSPTPPAYGNEAPIFAPPRQNSRVEIRKPTAEDEINAKKSVSPRPAARNGPSSLRSSVTSSSASSVPRSIDPTAPVFIPPTHSQHPSQEYFPNPSQASAYAVGPAEEHRPHPPPMDVGMMGYPPYQQQQYYYPEQYGYQPYIDMPQQVVQYDVYPPDPRGASQVYY